jgi:hypothetical protein
LGDVGNGLAEECESAKDVGPVGGDLPRCAVEMLDEESGLDLIRLLQPGGIPKEGLASHEKGLPGNPKALLLERSSSTVRSSHHLRTGLFGIH